MPWFRNLLWFATMAMIVILYIKSWPLQEHCFWFLELDETKAKAIYDSWSAEQLKRAQAIITLDNIFIVFYVLLMINCSNYQMNLESNLLLNNLLRASMPLSVVAGVVDAVENYILRQNIEQIEPHINLTVITTIKFILVIWIVALWFFVKVTRGIRNRTPR